MTQASEDLVGVVLAAGASRRMGEGTNKLLETIGGRPMVAAPISAFAEAGISRILVVVGSDADRVRSALASGPPVTFVENARWEEGMGTSLAAAARFLLADDARRIEGVLVTVGDLPGLSAPVVREVVRSFRSSASPRRICLPSNGDRDGHPVLFAPDHLPGLARLEGDRGARSIIDAQGADVIRVTTRDEGVLRDVDTPEALASERAR